MKGHLLVRKLGFFWLMVTVFFSVTIFFMSEMVLVSLLVGLMSGVFWLLVVWQRRQQQKELVLVADLLRAFLDGRAMPNEVSQLELKETLSGKVRHELLRLEEQYSGYHAKVTRDQKALQQLISDIAHQLRTPLVTIKTYSGLLNQSADLLAANQSYLRALDVSEAQLTFLIESFIKMSRFENDLIQLMITPNNVNETILQTVFKLHSAALAKNITIESANNDLIMADYDQNWLGEALFNVLDNSIKYSAAGGVIHLSVQKDEMFTVISCRDEGIGIEPGEESELFKRFYRGKKVSHQAGFGIGLYLAQEIMLKHRGFIKVTRETSGLTVALYV